MKLDSSKIRKYHTMGTVRAIIEITQNLPLEELLTDLFIYTENDTAKLLIKKYESQLVISSTNPDKFKEGLHDFYRNTAEFIRKNNLQREFLSFWYFVYSSLSTKEHPSRNALNCYFNILAQQFDYFTTPQYTVYGLTSNNKWLVRPEPYPNLEVPFIQNYKTKNFNAPTLFAELRKMGFPVYTADDLDSLIHNDHLLNNMFYVLSNFIDEKTMTLYPQDFYLVAHGIKIPPSINPTSFYKEILDEKHYFLPIKGVKGVYHNSGEIAEIFFQEVFAENRIVLLYRVIATNGKGYCGLYDNDLKFFYSPWSDTSNGLSYHQNLENLVLQSYAYLTTDIEQKLEEQGFFKGLTINDDTSSSNLPSVEFLYDEAQHTNAGEKTERFRLFEKKRYQEVLVKINPYIRRLPSGAKASPEAIELAKKFHIVLRPGETFVRPFEKKAYVKK